MIVIMVYLFLVLEDYKYFFVEDFLVVKYVKIEIFFCSVEIFKFFEKILFVF